MSDPRHVKLYEEMVRLKGENDQLEATNIRVTQMVSDFKARVAELEGQDVVSSICESCHDGYSYSAPERKTSFLLGVTCPACLGDNIEILMSERDRYRKALERVRDEARIVFDAKTIAQEALEVKDE